MFYIKASENFPEVIMSANQGIFKIRGISTDKHVDSFYAPILTWLDEYIKKPNKTTKISFFFEKFNIDSAKKILAILYKFHDLHNQGHDTSCIWYYDEGNDALLELGLDFQTMVDCPFIIKKVNPIDTNIF